MSDKLIPMLLWCPECGERHIDRGRFETKVHHTHSCQHCGFTWRPAVVATVGVQFLPGFKDDHPCESCGRTDGEHNVGCMVALDEAYPDITEPTAVKMLRLVSLLCPMGRILQKDVVEALNANDAGQPYKDEESRLARQAYGEKGLNDGTD